jgi:hypothetical protein
MTNTDAERALQIVALSSARIEILSAGTAGTRRFKSWERNQLYLLLRAAA